MKRILYLLTTTIIFSFVCHSQGDQTNIQVPIDGTFKESALLHLPDDYTTTNNKYPLIVFLHGGGEAGNNLNKIYNSATAGGPAYFIAHNKWPSSFTNPSDGKAYKFIVLSPQNNSNWTTTGKQLAYVLNYMVANYHVDASKIYITGLSVGGASVLDYATHNGVVPTFIPAAIIPMSAATSAPASSWANKIISQNIQTWGFGSDPQDIFGTYLHNLIKDINLAKAGFGRFTNYSGGHCCWNNFYNPEYKETVNGKTINIYEWLLQFSSNSVVNPVTDPALIVKAGPDQSLLLPVDSTTLSGSGSSSNAKIVSYKWSVLSGPNSPVLEVPSSGNSGNDNGNGNQGNGNGNGNQGNGNGNGNEGNGNGNGNQGNGNNQGNGGTANSNGGHTYTLHPDNQGYLVINNSNNFYKPGDILYLSGYFKSVAIENMSGSSSKYILITNKPNEKLIVGDSTWSGGAYAQGMTFGNCHYIEVAGTDKLHFHVVGGNTRKTDGNGFQLRTAYMDFAIGYFSDNFKVHDISIRYGGAGLWCKTEIDSHDSRTWYPNTFLNNFEFYNLEIRNTYNEAMYIGHTAPYWNIQSNSPYYPSSSNDRTASDNPTVYKQPIKLRNVKIHDNYIHDIGNDGIQCAAIDNLEIYGNEVTNWATKHGVNDQAGIMPGGRVDGFNVHDNYVHDSWGELMEVYAEGSATSIINNNLFVHGLGEGISMRGGGNLNVQFTNNTIAFTNAHSVRVNGYFGQKGAILNKNIFISPMISFRGMRLDNKSFVYSEGGANTVEGSLPNDNIRLNNITSDIDINNWFTIKPGSKLFGYGYNYHLKAVSVSGTSSISNATPQANIVTASSSISSEVGSPTVIVKNLIEGTYLFQLTITDNLGQKGAAQVKIEVKNPIINQVNCSATGEILREEWDNRVGRYVADIPLNSSPTSTSYLKNLEFTNLGVMYGDRTRGYICAPQTGNYTFFIASDDASELWLSTDSTVDNKQKIAYVSDYVHYRTFNRFPTQTSKEIPLIAGEKYYIEILHKQEYGLDHLTVGWQLPNKTQEIPLSGSHLSPFEITALSNNEIQPSSRSGEISTTNASIKIYPNPFESRATVTYIASESGQLSIDLLNIQGHRLKNLFSGNVNSGEVKNVNVDGTGLSSGIYMINITSRSRSINQKLMLMK